MTDNLATQLEGLSPDKLAALFKRMNIDVVKQEDDYDFNSMRQFSAHPRQG
jgi:hypothetical protein